MKVRAQTFEQFHGKRGVGSTRLRIHQLIKYWPEFELYKYGEDMDVMIFQKVYMTPDYRWPEHLNCVKILDICDPDWLDGSCVKEMIDVMNGVTCPTESLAEFLRQLTDKPVKVIPDRHDLDGLPVLKEHKSDKPSLVWFGYEHNAELLKFAVPTIEKLGLDFTVISNHDPQMFRWADDPETFKPHYHYIKFDSDNLIKELRKHDIAVLPQGNRPKDRFKSNNRTIICHLAGLPVAQDGDELRSFLDPAVRNKEAEKNYEIAKKDYNVEKSVTEMKEFIEELK